MQYLGQKALLAPPGLTRAMVSASLKEKLKFSSRLSSVLHFTKLTRGLVMIFHC